MYQRANTLPLTRKRPSTSHPASLHSPSSSSSGSPIVRLARWVLDRPVPSFFAAVIGVLCVSLLVGLHNAGDRERDSAGRRVVARDWSEGRHRVQEAVGGGKSKRNEGLLSGHKGETVLILTPMKNSLEHIWHFFHLLDTLTYPRSLLQIGILVSDSSDRTYLRALELADERQYSHSHARSSSGRGGRYSRISVFRKDFLDPEGEGGEVEKKVGNNIGTSRHDYGVQVERRKLLARSRTWLLGAAMTPEVDHVLWMDVDVVEYEKDLVQTLLGWGNTTGADVVVPNCMWKTYNEMGSYDRNNWAETEESLALKKTLSPDDVLIEGYESHLKTFRTNMADYYPSNDTTPETMDLDGVGGCTALVKADVHREGAVFPAWVVDHQLETEGFAQLAKALGKKLVGLPKYYVYHGLYG